MALLPGLIAFRTTRSRRSGDDQQDADRDLSRPGRTRARSSATADRSRWRHARVPRNVVAVTSSMPTRCLRGGGSTLGQKTVYDCGVYAPRSSGAPAADTSRAREQAGPERGTLSRIALAASWKRRSAPGNTPASRSTARAASWSTPASPRSAGDRDHFGPVVAGELSMSPMTSRSSTGTARGPLRHRRVCERGAAVALRGLEAARKVRDKIFLIAAGLLEAPRR